METSESSSSVPRVSVEDDTTETRDFVYKLHSKGISYELRVPLKVPYTGNSRELAVRLISAHKLPCYLQDDLCSQLQKFGQEETLKLLDEEAELNLYGGSVLEKGSETEQAIDKWVDCFTENTVEFAAPVDPRGVEKIDVNFSEVYHKLIHSPALETLLQLEHTYAVAVLELCKARDNAREIMQKRHDTELSEAMEVLGSRSSEADINTMMRQHTLEREQSESMWSSELSQLQESQRREYRDWVLKVHEETTETDKGRSSSKSSLGRRQMDSGALSTGPPETNDSVFTTDTELPLEESFTIHLGAQKKTMHNVRVICGDPLDLCRHKHGHTHPAASPERLLTAMSLYSSKLSALVIMVDGRVNSLGGIKESFGDVCHQSTDFHFQDIDVQLSQIQECALIGNGKRREHKLTESLSTHTSDSQISRSTSPLLSISPDRNGPFGPTDPTSNSTHHLSLDYDPGLVTRPLGGQGEVLGQDREDRSSSLLDTTSVSLEPGDFYLTRHSNLSNVHMVLHLVTDEAAVQSTSLKSRHPVVLGLKNCLRTAARHDVHHITIPLLLVHTMQPEMTINWCLKRAELIFKCVKGFMLENSSWGDGDSRTIQFLVPSGISKDVFDEFCEMLPRVFRITSTRNLTRRRGYSYK